MMIRSGLGFLVAVITLGCALGTEALVEAWFQDDHYYQSHGWPKFVAFVVAAVIVGVLAGCSSVGRGRSLSILRRGPRFVGVANTFFFIPMEYIGRLSSWCLESYSYSSQADAQARDAAIVACRGALVTRLLFHGGPTRGRGMIADTIVAVTVRSPSGAG